MIVDFEWKNIRNYISCFQSHNNTYFFIKKIRDNIKTKTFIIHAYIYIYIYSSQAFEYIN